MSVNTKSETNPFNKIIQLEEITHFQKPHKPIKSILSNSSEKYKTRLEQDNIWSNNGPHKKVSYSPTLNNPENYFETEAKVFNDLSEKENFNQNDVKDNSSSSSKYFSFHEKHSESDESLDGSESDDTEFRRDFTKLPTTGRENSPQGSEHNSFEHNFISDENLFPFPNQNIEVTKWDAFFACIVFFIHFMELLTDFVMAVWHYHTNQMWGCAFTSLFIACGGIAMLHQFGMIQPDQLDRIFRKGKRMRIFIHCFPPLATSLVSLEGAISANKSVSDPMQSQQYFKISELSRNLARVQSFFQAAPLTAVQLVILLENLHETSSSKACFTIFNIIISLAIMTNANLPSKTDAVEDSSSKVAYLPFTRIFVGTRMFSSLGSRLMAIAFLLVGCRCILHDLNIEGLYSDRSQNSTQIFIPSSSSSPTVSSTFIGLSLLIFPRLVFTITDYLSMKRFTSRNLEHYRDQPELGVSSSHPIETTPLISMFVGYLATISFPVGDPIWLFWYLWCESAIFIIFGNVASLHDNFCLDHFINWMYTTIFIVTFVIVPFLIPAAKAAVHRRRMEKVRRILQVQVVNNEEIIEPQPTNSGNADN